MMWSAGVTNRFARYFSRSRFTDAAALLWLMILGGNAHADGVGLPTNVCHDFCGASQQQMWARFEAGGTPNFAALPKVYAGVCHVLGGNINPEHEHHVGFMVDNAAGDRQLQLRFSFFTAVQPYNELTAAQARESFGAPVLPLSVHDGYAYAEIIGQRFFARYWLRRDSARERTLLVSYFGDRVTILCDAASNHASNH